MAKRFWIGFWLILLFAFLLRIIPPQNNNFFFTMDQADDGVWARELFERGQILWHGSQTSIPGVWAGPLWYYFIAIGYKVFNGDPFGALFMIIFLNVALTGVLMYVISKKVGKTEALTIGLLLQFFWWFYDTSRWAFNPFPLVSVAVVTLLLLTNFLGGHKRSFTWAGIVALLGFNFEIAGAAAIFLFYLAFGVYAFLKKKIGLKGFLATGVLIPSVVLSVIIFELSTQFVSSRFLFKDLEHGVGVFSGTNFLYMGQRFLEMLSYAVFPYHSRASLLAFLVLLTLFFKIPKRNKFVTNFVSLTILLTFVSWIFSGSNKGWYDWHTLYIPILLFISVLLMALSRPKVGAVVLAVIILFQLPVFKERYLQYLTSQEDPSVLATELKVLDWIYSKREGDGFNAYTYMFAIRDYPYQYLFWWYGRKTYGFVPCEYTIYPGELKYLYVPGAQFYQQPQLGCDKFRFLIIAPAPPRSRFGEAGKREEWYEKVAAGTKLVEEMSISGVRVEKRVLTP